MTLRLLPAKGKAVNILLRHCLYTGGNANEVDDTSRIPEESFLFLLIEAGTVRASARARALQPVEGHHGETRVALEKSAALYVAFGIIRSVLEKSAERIIMA